MFQRIPSFVCKFSNYTRGKVILLVILPILFTFNITTLLWLAYPILMNHFHCLDTKPHLKFTRCAMDAKTPIRGSLSSAGLDLFCNENVILQPHSRKLVSTGLQLSECPYHHYLRIAPRSGLSCKGLDVGAGVVDSDYRGTIKVLLINHNDTEFRLSKHTRIAQIICEKISFPRISVDGCKVDQNNASIVKERGEGGFGSTGQ